MEWLGPHHCPKKTTLNRTFKNMIFGLENSLEHQLLSPLALAVDFAV
jgi:hypothetical protein